MTRAILRPKQAAEYLGISRAQLYRLACRGDLPAPIKISSRASGWLVTDLDSFIERKKDGRYEHGD
ncbi:helix-turn-helix transcriptional regulator [Deferrisoma camini]|uniref:helix-turn-helix transcriptional regulator n=1 Tax=Deferrisoma camini TaxID=1035120 RepID=UPI0009FFD692